jgi:hypothetical protein
MEVRPAIQSDSLDLMDLRQDISLLWPWLGDRADERDMVKVMNRFTRNVEYFPIPTKHFGRGNESRAGEFDFRTRPVVPLGLINLR